MTPRILIVDDEPINLATMEGFLGADGYDLHFASDGRSACEKARALRPDLILLDVMLPESDGFNVCRSIRADPAISRIPVVLVTALSDQKSRLEGLRAGADDFITKPCLRDEIRARVKTIAALNRFRAIAEQRTRFERLYDVSPTAIVLADHAGRVLAANRQAQATFGAGEAAALVGANVGTWFDQGAAIADIIATALRPDTRPPQQLRRQAGAVEQIFWLRAAAVPDGDATVAMLVFDDVTAEVTAREQLQRMNEQLDELVRARTRQLEDANALLLSYASFVSHDLRSPLTVMKGYLDLLNEGVVEIPAEAKRMVGLAHRSACRMSDMIRNILQLAHEVHDGPIAMPPLDPVPVLVRLVAHVQDMAPNPRTEFLVGALPPVGVSAALLERVFYNLLTNAAKFSADQECPEVEVGTIAHEEGPVLFVRDNGVGFDARDNDKLFHEFSRLGTAAKTDGLGLGLSLVARLLRANGGRIWAESKVGEGATFYVLLPRPAAELVGTPLSPAETVAPKSSACV